MIRSERVDFYRATIESNEELRQLAQGLRAVFVIVSDGSEKNAEAGGGAVIFDCSLQCVVSSFRWPGGSGRRSYDAENLSVEDILLAACCYRCCRGFDSRVIGPCGIVAVSVS